MEVVPMACHPWASHRLISTEGPQVPDDAVDPEREREIISLRHGSELDAAEIARVPGADHDAAGRLAIDAW
jgi:hypothetical protein